MISKVSEVISNPIEIAVLGGASTVFSIAGNPRTTQPPDATKPELSLLTGQSSGFLCRFERNAHKPFFICGYSFQNEPGFQRDGNSFGSGLSNRGESALLAGESNGDSVPVAVVSKGGSAALAGSIQ